MAVVTEMGTVAVVTEVEAAAADGCFESRCMLLDQSRLTRRRQHCSDQLSVSSADGCGSEVGGEDVDRAVATFAGGGGGGSCLC